MCGGFGMAASENVPTEEGLRSPVVLVVEDVVLVRTLIAERLRSRGFDVVEAADVRRRWGRPAFPCMRY
jgi:hypothetical protein